ncbi:MAG: NYN domain-containing protein [Fimbriiglobus sp.]
MRTFLIDGYNLMHAAGLVAARGPAVKWQKAREKFLDWIADADPVRAGVARVQVIFDAQNGTGDGRERSHRAEVWVRFAPRRTRPRLGSATSKRARVSAARGAETGRLYEPAPPEFTR